MARPEKARQPPPAAGARARRGSPPRRTGRERGPGGRGRIGELELRPAPAERRKAWNGSGERRSGAAPDLDPLDAPAPERLRKGRRGGPGRQDVVDDRHPATIGRPAADAERTRDVLTSFRRASGSRLGRGMAPVDTDPPRPRDAQRPPDDGGQLFRVVESAPEEPPPGDGQPDHRPGQRKAGAGHHLPGEEPPERGRRRELPAILHAMDEAAERWCEGPRCDHPIEGRWLFEARRARRGCGTAGRRRAARGVHGDGSGAARADRAKKQRLQGAFAVGAGVVRNPDLAAEAARPREEPVQHRALNSRSLQHRPHSPPAPEPDGTDPDPATAGRRPPCSPAGRRSGRPPSAAAPVFQARGAEARGTEPRGAVTACPEPRCVPIRAWPEACVRWGFRRACLSRTLLGTASWERLWPACKWDGEAAADRCGRATSVPRTPCPCKQLRGVKSAGNPLEPAPNHGRTPSPWG